LNSGLNKIVDDQGLDWWDLICPRWIDRIEQFLRIGNLVQKLPKTAEVFVGAEGTYTAALRNLLPGRSHFFSSSESVLSKALRKGRLFSNLSFRQVLETAGDKYDGAYRFRRYIAPRRRQQTRDTVLLPSGYSNATRMALGYAADVSDLGFLVVASRRSGWPSR